MNIGILSGKGGTGKTTVSTNLAKILKATYIDCDVEEPNGFIFLKPEITKEEDVKVIFPVVDDKKCTNCCECVIACEFNALARVGEDIMLFQKLCHGCTACKFACDYDAVSFQERSIGKVEEGTSGDIKCKRGILNIGEPMAVPVIKKLLSNVEDELNIIDCSPGTSCNVVNTLQKIDMAILVTEPTEFGLHDLKLAVGLVQQLNIPFGIVINKEVSSENIIRHYCRENSIQIIGSIPYSREVAAIYSKGKMLVEDEKFKTIFQNIAEEMKVVKEWN
ncbi:P-loop NTPase [Haloimpatiens sp. FM7330]|uniref:P-loop NTPase n=1 Tax=Haloimpatiens sp. FM7330 TaxID=3298610 RepID=UPI00362FA008